MKVAQILLMFTSAIFEKKVDSQFETKLIHTVRGTGYVLRVES